ncbi:hypothetical protein [Roseomonas sp. WA12]
MTIKMSPIFRALLTGWQLHSGVQLRLVRDAALWMRAPANRRPVWSKRG